MRRGRGGVALAISLALGLVALSPAVRADIYDPPATYYDNAVGTGATLKGQLYGIISTGTTPRTYGDSRYADALLDRDPANPNNILLIYNRASVSGTWDNGVTFNREHVWPASLLGNSSPANGYIGSASDLFELRPCNVGINTSRDNSPYGRWDVAAPSTGYGVIAGDFFNPGPSDRGDVARILFYMATRYGQGQTNNLTLVDGHDTGTYTMGDKQSLLHWHYEDAVDTFERRRNHLIYSATDNPTYAQRNRNPYIDHPEWVWSVFGGTTNDSQLAVAAPDAGGASAATVDLGRVIVNASFGTGTVALNKTGANPTTFDATLAGDATSAQAGPRQTFNYNAGTRSIVVGLGGSTATPGAKLGTLTIDNTDVTAGSVTGRASSDGNDVVSVRGAVVAHASPSFELATAQLTQTIDFGIVAQDATAQQGFAVADRAPSGVYVAGLDIDSVGTPADGAFTTTLVPQANLAAGTAAPFVARVGVTTLGVHSSSIAIATSDENIPGATTLGTLTLSLTVRIAIGGDATLDDAVGFDDLLVVAQNYEGGATTWVTGDFDRTGTTDFGDLLVLAQHYGVGGLLGTATLADAAGVTPVFLADWALAQSLVPEPATLMAVAFTFVVGRRRRQ